MNTLNNLTIAAARDGLRKGDFTAAELADACLGAIDEAGALNAFAHNTPEIAREQAAAADARLAAGDAPDLCGIALGVMDSFCTKGVPSQAGSRILDGFRPEYESTVTARLWRDGAVMLGKLNMDEFSMGVSGETSVHGPAVSPWQVDGSALTPGGAASGPATAVAADLCLGAAASDTGGSIRQPAAYSGVTGLKPTWGRVSRWGLIALASSLDQAGPMARDIRDAAIMLAAMAGHDPGDSTSGDQAVPDFESMLTGDIRSKVIGIPREYRLADMNAEIAALWDQGAQMLRDAGAEVREISLPHTKYALSVFHIIAPAEASSNLARYDGVRFGHRARIGPGDGINEMYDKTRAEGFGPEVQRRLFLGTHLLTAGLYDATYNHARKVRRLIHDDFTAAFADGIDAILTPATPSPATALVSTATADPVTMYDSNTFTMGASLAGLPALSLPVGVNGQGLPLGLQLIGRPWAEDNLLNTGFSLERAAGFVASPARWW